MRYQIELNINAPRENVVDLFLDVDNLREWQPSLVKFEMVTEGKFRGVGAQSRQFHKMNNNEAEVLATITHDNYPEEFFATFVSDGVWNLIENRFTEHNDNQTKWTLMAEYRCERFVMKALMFLFPSMFKKQTQQYMQNFKEFVEGEK